MELTANSIAKHFVKQYGPSVRWTVCYQSRVGPLEWITPSTEEELKKAIDTDSLWENLVQLTDNLNDYSVFHQVINRNSKNNTMDILFVASKLSDVNAFSSIIKKSNLNPVIMDVRCFTLKNAFDNIAISAGTKQNSAIMDFGLEENYLMIIHNNIPIITDIFLRPQEKQSILQAKKNQENEETDLRRPKFPVPELDEKPQTREEKVQEKAP